MGWSPSLTHSLTHAPQGPNGTTEGGPPPPPSAASIELVSYRESGPFGLLLFPPPCPALPFPFPGACSLAAAGLVVGSRHQKWSGARARLFDLFLLSPFAVGRREGCIAVQKLSCSLSCPSLSSSVRPPVRSSGWLLRFALLSSSFICPASFSPPCLGDISTLGGIYLSTAPVKGV